MLFSQAFGIFRPHWIICSQKRYKDIFDKTFVQNKNYKIIHIYGWNLCLMLGGPNILDYLKNLIFIIDGDLFGRLGTNFASW